MDTLWKNINGQHWTAGKKCAVFVWTVSVLSGLVGLAGWRVVSFFALGSPEWMVVFGGLPVLGSWVGVFLYTCRHPFHGVHGKSTGVDFSSVL